MKTRSFRSLSTSWAFGLAAGLCLLGSAPVHAHVSLVQKTGPANATQELSFGVGHGCSGADTYSVRIEIPAGVTSVRPGPNNLGPATVEKNAAGQVIAVTWQKAADDVVAGDPNYYKLSLRLKLPNTPFVMVYFPTRQICRMPGGADLPPVDWAATPAMPDAGAGEPAPEIAVLPPYKSGWNKFTVPQPITDLAAFFGDAEIVWKGTAAFSANPDTAALITTTPGATALTSLAAGDVIWVRY